jgi:hypothetical protein
MGRGFRGRSGSGGDIVCRIAAHPGHSQIPEPPSGFPAEPIPGGYVVRDANGQALAYLYSRDNEDEALRC